LVREGVATVTEIETVMSLDDVDLWNLYLEASDEASIRGEDY
jgi:hypothetical protein